MTTCLEPMLICQLHLSLQGDTVKTAISEKRVNVPPPEKIDRQCLIDIF